jgi:phospholipid-binding lipoprotein MlaA
LSITNIVAMAMLSGSLQCPPVNEAPSAVEATSAPVNVQTPISVEASDKAALVSAPVAGLDINAVPVSSAMTAAQIIAPQVMAAPVGGTITQGSLPSDIASQANPTNAVATDKNIIVVTARTGPPPGYPVEAVNEVSFVAVQAVDEAIVAPVAQGYVAALPHPLRDGIHNAIDNLDEPIVFVNFVLQLKIGKALETVGRFAINSTVGVGGLLDVAKKKPFNLPRRSNGLADTLGYYGVGPGPYLFLPVVGSTTIRDLLGRVVDLSLLPAAVGKPFTDPIVSASKGILSSIDDRVRNDEILTRIQQSGNPYAAMREYYLKKRQAEIAVLQGKRCNADINLAELEFMDSLPAEPTATAKPKVQLPALQMP